MKVTWTTSGRIHRTTDGVSTICGHVFGGAGQNVRGIIHLKRKRHCKTCFACKADFADQWLVPPFIAEKARDMGNTLTMFKLALLLFDARVN